MLQPGVIIDRNPLLQMHRRLNPALRLLHHMPRFMRQMLLLSRRNVDVSSLGEGQCIELRRLGGVVMHPDVVQRDAGNLFDVCFERVGQAGLVGRGLWLAMGCRLMVRPVDCHIGEVVAGLRRAIGTALHRVVRQARRRS
jgi:hypothetical protein